MLAPHRVRRDRRRGTWRWCWHRPSPPAHTSRRDPPADSAAMPPLTAVSVRAHGCEKCHASRVRCRHVLCTTWTGLPSLIEFSITQLCVWLNVCSLQHPKHGYRTVLSIVGGRALHEMALCNSPSCTVSACTDYEKWLVTGCLKLAAASQSAGACRLGLPHRESDRLIPPGLICPRYSPRPRTTCALELVPASESFAKPVFRV